MSRPIGYWIKAIDLLIEESFVRLLSEQHLTRRHWQVLNTIADGPLPAAEVNAALTPFQPGVAAVVDELVARGWVEREGGVLTLTEAGHSAHRTVSERVMANRRALTDGISAEEYASVINLLERMANNLRGATTGS